MKKVSIPLIAVLIIAGILFANKEEVKQWFAPEANLCDVGDSGANARGGEFSISCWTNTGQWANGADLRVSLAIVGER